MRSYSRNGHHFTERFPSIDEFPAKAPVLDAEVVASDPDGRPEFLSAARALDEAEHDPPVGSSSGHTKRVARRWG
jgi:ATP-dependent DNA ligase